MALIEFKNVNKYYGDYHALRDINLEIEKGQVVVILGPSGSGKSTLIRTINALEPIDEGTLIVNGHNVTEASAKDLVELRKEVGMVFQHFNLYPHKTVLENVTLAPIKVLGISKAEAEKTAEKFLRYVNMWDKKDSYPGMLSGGQKQRIAIARGLEPDGRVLLRRGAGEAHRPQGRGIPYRARLRHLPQRRAQRQEAVPPRQARGPAPFRPVGAAPVVHNGEPRRDRHGAFEPQRPVRPRRLHPRTVLQRGRVSRNYKENVGARHAAPGAALAHWYAVGEGTAGPGAALV